MFNLTLFAMVQPGTTIDERRALIDYAFQIVAVYEGPHIKTLVQSGSWDRIIQSSVLRKTLNAVAK